MFHLHMGTLYPVYKGLVAHQDNSSHLLHQHNPIIISVSKSINKYVGEYILQGYMSKWDKGEFNFHRGIGVLKKMI